MVFPTRDRSTFMVAAALSIAGLALSACGASKGSEDQSPSGIDEGASVETAALSLLLVNAPSDALCLQLAVFPAAAMSGGKTQLFDITPGSSPTLGMTGLPSGNANLTASAFGVPCAQVQASTSPTWVSAGPVAVTLVAGQTLTTSIVLRKPSAIQVTATFDDGSLSITPNVMDFGVTQVGGSATATFSVVNPGTVAVTLSAPTLTGTDASQFQVYQNGCGATLEAGAACTVSVLFTPTGAGSRTATLNVGTGSAALTGTGLAGGLTITPNPVNFASTAVGTTTSLTITLTNNAAIALSVGGWTITGASDFGLGTTTCGASLAAASSCTHVITFSPLSGGAKTATLTNSAGASATLNGSASASTAYRINCGSNAAVAPFAVDQYVSGGTQHSVTNTINLSAVTNPAPQAVYQSERYGNMTYTFPGLAPSAQYTVRLHFAELYWTSTGRRVFSVTINGSPVLSNFDIYASAGGNYRALVREQAAVASSSGQIVVKFTTVTDNASISGIEIIPSCTPSCAGRCGGSDGCGGTCSNTCIAPQICGGDNQCVCPSGTCGSSCMVCGGSTPYCSAGQCVQCTSSSQCGTGGTCNGGQCVCRATSASNLLVSPDFTTSSQLANWNAASGVTWSTDDADGCPGSGSALVSASSGVISQCIPASPGSTYYMSVRSRSSDTNATPSCYYDFRTPGCAETIFGGVRFAGPVSTTWTNPSPAHDVAPSGAGALQLTCTAQGGSVLFDQFDVHTCPAGTCGSDCVTCGGSTPYCSSAGQCVQCTSSSQCPGGGACNSSGQCVCQGGIPGNLLTTPYFHTSSELANWNANAGATWYAEDSSGCADSGSVLVNSSGTVSQCIPATPGVKYFAGVRYKTSDSSTQASCYYDFRTPGCGETTFITARFAGGPSTTWKNAVSEGDVAPAEAGAIRVSCQTQGNSVLFDDFSVTTCPANTCGSSCVTCGGSTPNCLHGQCVQCNSSSQCAAGRVCSSSGQCVCRAKSAGNLLTSPGFESSSELFSWGATSGATWSTDDADGCAESGSVLVNSSNGSVSQCVPVTPGSRYYVGVRYKSSDASSQPSCYWDFRTYGCAETTYILGKFAGGASTTWTTAAGGDVAPADAQTLQVSCQTFGNSVLFDQFYVNVGTDTGY